MNKDGKTKAITLGEYLSSLEKKLEDAKVYLGHGTDNYWDEAVHLVLQTLGIPLASDEDVLQQALRESDLEKVESKLRKRIDERIPVPYIVGKAWFFALPFIVNENVLIPRSPLAELIAKGFQPWLPLEKLQGKPVRILDLCCGSGCIGIACAKAFSKDFPQTQVTLADISKEALAVSQSNIELHGLAEQVTLCEGDLFAGLSAEKSAQRFDLIVANPPYVDTEDMAALPEEYHHEPRMALESGQDGLNLVRRILQEASDYLTDDGVLIVEVGNSWQALEEAYPEVPFLWLEFEQGGHGVFLFTAEELQAYGANFL